MEITLLGTGAADGWPNPFCTCSSCEAMRVAGEIRGQTSALIDEVILLDCGPETPRAAERARRPLSRVHTILLTHAHPDHVGPAALLWRAWAQRREPLEVIGPSSAIELCRAWVGPDDPVTFTEVGAGQAFVRSGYQIRTLAANHTVSAHELDSIAAGAVLYDVTSPDGSRILYATDTGPLADETLDVVSRDVADTPYDIVMLEATFGDRVAGVDLGDQHHDLNTFATTIASLRRTGAVTDNTDLIAIHLGHHNPPTPQLNARLSAWGARAVPDGTLLPTRAEASLSSGGVSPSRRRLILGGARSGKSRHAEELLMAHPRVTYVASGLDRGDDPEWTARIAEHQQRRPSHWITTETTDLVGVLESAASNEGVLIDCLTVWLAAVCDDVDRWTTPELRDADADDAVQQRIAGLIEAIRRTPAQVVLVSNEVGSGIVPDSHSGREFRDLLGTLNSQVARACDQTVLVVAGHVVNLTVQDEATRP